MPGYLIVGDPSALRRVPTHGSLSALMGGGEVAVMLEISSRMEQNAVACRAVNPCLLNFVVSSFFFPFNLVLAKAAGTFCLSC